MDWTKIEWSYPGPDDYTLLESLATHGPLIRSAMDEGAAAAILGPAAIISIQTATCARADLPDGFVALSTFELLGTDRRPIGATLDPTAGAELGGTAVTVETMGQALLTAIDEALGALLGDGLGLGPANGLPLDDELLLIRLGISSQPGPDVEPEVAVVVVMAGAAKAELASHLIALHAMSGATNGATSGATSETAAEASSILDQAAVDAVLAAALEAAGAPAIVDFTPTAMAAVTAPAPVAPPVVPAPQPPPAAAPPPPALSAAQASAIRTVDFPALPPAPASNGRQSLDLLLGVSLEVTVEIGRARLSIRDVLSLTPGSVVELDKLAGEKVDVLVNRYHIATGEVVVVDENFGVRITDVIARERRVLPDGRE